MCDIKVTVKDTSGNAISGVQALLCFGGCAEVDDVFDMGTMDKLGRTKLQFRFFSGRTLHVPYLDNEFRSHKIYFADDPV